MRRPWSTSDSSQSGLDLSASAIAVVVTAVVLNLVSITLIFKWRRVPTASRAARAEAGSEWLAHRARGRCVAWGRGLATAVVFNPFRGFVAGHIGAASLVSVGESPLPSCPARTSPLPGPRNKFCGARLAAGWSASGCSRNNFGHISRAGYHLSSSMGRNDRRANMASGRHAVGAIGASEDDMSSNPARVGGVDAKGDGNGSFCASHRFTESDIEELHTSLLVWYERKQRRLPWRRPFEPADGDQQKVCDAPAVAANPGAEKSDLGSVCDEQLNKRAYEVWVSEIMLQQTRVETVKDYYSRWIARWPTVQDLAGATLEEVNQVWAGLGYYRRAKFLHEGAKQVVAEMDGQVPDTVEGLLKVKGVGRYTAGAVASIAFGRQAPIVDGNVVRVMARLRSIGAPPSKPATTALLWELAEQAVHPRYPGDLNQALMELGATVCTPKSPSCSECPVRAICRANQDAAFGAAAATTTTSSSSVSHADGTTKISNFFRPADGVKRPRVDNKVASSSDVPPELETATKWAPRCEMCPPKQLTDVVELPRKEKRCKVRHEAGLVCVVVSPARDKVLLYRRAADGGLLAGLWDFPLVSVPATPSKKGREGADVVLQGLQDIICDALASDYGVAGVSTTDLVRVGKISHVFSHIKQELEVVAVDIKGECMQVTAGEALRGGVGSEYGSDKRWVAIADVGSGELPMSKRAQKCFAVFTDSAVQGCGADARARLDAIATAATAPSLSSKAARGGGKASSGMKAGGAAKGTDQRTIKSMFSQQGRKPGALEE